MADIGILPRDAVARRLNRELFVALGSTAAVLLQMAHPLVAAGVDQHSDFRRDPFGRFHRTANTSLDAVFGTTARARRALRRIDARHVSVKGTAEDGRSYRARDPQLLLWVQATLVLALEALNTALELAITLASPERHPLAKAAKDVSAAMVLIAAIGSVLVGIAIFRQYLG